MFYAVSALLISSLFFLFLYFYFWLRCSVGATYRVAFSFAVSCQLFIFSVICYFDSAVYIFYDVVGYVIFFTS